MKLPNPRGPISEHLVDALARDPYEIEQLVVHDSRDPLTDEDLQLALFIAYELHYRGWDGVDERWEWEPSLLRLRAALEGPFEAALRELAGAVPTVEPAEVPHALSGVVAADDGPSLAKHLQTGSSVAEFREFMMHRAVYHLREADPHSFAIPRLSGRAKAALVEIQADEYGQGRYERMHATLFANTMTALGLDTTYGAYVEAAPAITLATNNTMSLFGLHRRLRGAVAGHLAAFEMTSSLPNRRYGNGLRRLGFDADATLFFDEHIEADAVHEQIAATDLCGSLCAAEPHLIPDVLFGATACLAVDARWATHLLTAWSADTTSLRTGP
ncbi:iron-containing redox enzyme family protein [Catenuloplanes sp. NPDC051500]|uniref:iron-containing redox enzyme family protein n=1 Tax=Catenuloplanes sp. NPDC051500 TaxID=3363959 RepID=UPI0037AAAFD0